MHACMSALVKLTVCSCITDDCIMDLYQYCNNGGLYVIDVTIVMIWKERERERERETLTQSDDKNCDISS